MHLKEFSRLSKYLSVFVTTLILLATTGLYAEVPEPKSQLCLSEMGRLRIESKIRLNAQNTIPKAPVLSPAPITTITFNEPMAFDEINRRVTYYLQNLEEFAKARTELRENMLLGQYDLKQFIALQLVVSPNMRRNWSRQLMTKVEFEQNLTGLQEKNGAKIVERKKTLGQRRIPFTQFKLEEIRIPLIDYRPFGSSPGADASRTWNSILGYIFGHLARYKITLPPILVGTESPDLAYAKLGISFGDALEKANAGSGSRIVLFEMKTFFNALGAGGMGLVDFTKVFIRSLQPLGVVNQDNISIWLNISARLFGSDPIRKQMLLDMIKNMKNPDYFIKVSAELSDNEFYILQSQGPQALIKQLVQTRGILESKRLLTLVAKLAVSTISTYFFIKDVIYRPPLGDSDTAGVCDPKGKPNDDTVLVDLPGKRPIYPFDPSFLPAQGQDRNPCDPDGIVKSAYDVVMKTHTRNASGPNSLADWYAENDTYSKIDGLPFHGNPNVKSMMSEIENNHTGTNVVESLMDEIRKNYIDTSTGCCIYFNNYSKMP